MKIAICINTSWNIYNFRKGLIEYFLQRGDEVLTIAPRDEYAAKLEEMGCSFEHLEMSASGLNPVVDFKLMMKLRKILKKHRPDVYLSYTIKPNIYGSVAAGTLGIPAICNVSGLGTVFLWKGSVKKIATTLYSTAFRFNKWIFFQNEFDREEFCSFVKMNMSKTSILPGSGMNVQRFTPAPDPMNTKVRFLMLSRLLVEKGVYEYVEAIQLLKERGMEADFWLIGGLDDNHSRAVARKDLNTWLTAGLLQYKDHVSDVIPEIAAADVVVLPSYREGTPRTLLESGAMARPLIATDVPGCNNVVVDGYNGLLCKVKSGEDLADKMQRMMEMSPEERRAMGTNARKYIEERFDEKLVIQLYADKIAELTSNGV